MSTWDDPTAERRPTDPPTDPATDPAVYAGVRTGPLRVGERVTLTDPKGRRHSVLLSSGQRFHTAKGAIAHDDLIGGPEGVVVTSAGGVPYLALRPLLGEFTTGMPRGAQVVYPKDAAQIVVGADIFPGARVLEAGAGSGALSLALLRAIGPTGRLTSYERREDFAAIAAKNVRNFLGTEHPAWDLRIGDLAVALGAGEDADPRAPAEVDRVVLDMLAPWECVDVIAERLVPGGVICCYIATTTQLGRITETLRVHGGFTEPKANESMVRGWHVEGLAIRPSHQMVGHTGFLLTARRLAPGVVAPARKRRPAPGAYGEDYTGPRRRDTASDGTEP
ncbi:tRNA (adenine-N1)-methyltransferase [Microlunatus sp. Gsoil 973]|uniref:tRNA (adenine-N1)-methyltransferase n=1 Tax=Microlunatus sp. Gsoil 973 TaxID=2672569 RepID=UPI0012B4BAE1|nr:tRNA (adenine-N1)-methyltransferase [Microlunatus sp. Gsoil 973]QGN32708.1 tRNA (adenine-N1)-methyltransferase [Microlunatus sp. Gsoil 973]